MTNAQAKGSEVLCAMTATGHRVLAARKAAMDAGLAPEAVEIGPGESLGEFVAAFAGMRIKHRAEPGITVLALPNRKIGRYEIVPPARFDAPNGYVIRSGPAPVERDLEAINGRLA